MNARLHHTIPHRIRQPVAKKKKKIEEQKNKIKLIKNWIRQMNFSLSVCHPFHYRRIMSVEQTRFTFAELAAFFSWIMNYDVVLFSSKYISHFLYIIYLLRGTDPIFQCHAVKGHVNSSKCFHYFLPNEFDSEHKSVRNALRRAWIQCDLEQKIADSRRNCYEDPHRLIGPRKRVRCRKGFLRNKDENNFVRKLFKRNFMEYHGISCYL